MHPPVSRLGAPLRLLRDPWLVAGAVVSLLYLAALTLDEVASTYPPVPNDACATLPSAARLANISFYLVAAGGLGAFVGTVGAVDKRKWFLLLLITCPVLAVTAFMAVFWPGADCRRFN